MAKIHKDCTKKFKKNVTDQDHLEKLVAIEQRLEMENTRFMRRQGYPWYVLFCVSVAVALLLQFAFIPGMEYTVVQTEENSVLKAELDTFISQTKFDELVFDNVLITAWDLKARQPYVLSTHTVRDQSIYQAYNDLSKATLLSAACPVYFKPVEDGERIFIGGDAMAVSPAMLAYLLATEEGRKDGSPIEQNEIEVFSIGSINERADRIPDDIGALEWLSRLDSLQGASKMHTQDYLLHHILEHHGTSLKKYTFSMSFKSSQALASMDPRLEELKHLCSDMINENRLRLEIDLKVLIMERFSAYTDKSTGQKTQDAKYKCKS